MDLNRTRPTRGRPRRKEKMRHVVFKTSTYDMWMKKKFEMCCSGITHSEFAEVLLHRVSTKFRDPGTNDRNGIPRALSHKDKAKSSYELCSAPAKSILDRFAGFTQPLSPVLFKENLDDSDVDVIGRTGEKSCYFAENSIQQEVNPMYESLTGNPFWSHQSSSDALEEEDKYRSEADELNVYVSLTKEMFEHMMFRCLECSSECRIRGKGRGENLTFKQECLICCNYRVWTSQAADLPDNKVTDECLPCDDARGPSCDSIPVTIVQEHPTESPKPTCEDSAQAAADSISMREKRDKNVREEELSLLMETHEDNDEEDDSNIALINEETTKPNYTESSDTLTADEELFIDECNGDQLAEKESDKSSQNKQEEDFDMHLLSSLDEANVSADDEILTDEDRIKGLTEKASDKSSKKRQQEDSEKHLPKSSDKALESCNEEIPNKGFTKKPFQNTIKPVIWCIDCEAVAKMLCVIQRHKNYYCCTACVSGSDVQNPSLKDFSVHFSDAQSFRLHAIAEHGSNVYEHKICQDCNKTIRVETDRNKKGHVCEYKIKPFSCNVCHKRFITEIGQKVHYRRLHRDYQHACKYCMMVFDTKQSKLEHEQGHKEDTLCYICPDCPEKFRDFVTRNEHLKTHPGKKKHTCSICNIKFSELYRYERHLRIHSGEKPFTCEVCNRSFNQDGHLKSHMRLHTGEKPFLCEHCGESFNHNISLRNHRQRHHGITDSSCVPAEENKPIGRPIRNVDQPRRQRKMCSTTADEELESCESDSDEEQQKRGWKRKGRRKKQGKNNVHADS